MLLAGCDVASARSADTSAALASIAAFNVRYLKAINDGDIDALSRLTNEDHIMLSPDHPAITGRADNDAANGRAFKTFKFEEHWYPIETVIDGDLGYQRGTFTVAASPRAGGAARTTHGNFLRIYRRQPDGSWWMTRDMFSGDEPAAAK